MPLPVFLVADHVVVIKVYEVVDIANAEHFRAELHRVLRGCRGPRSVVVDLRAPCATSVCVSALKDTQQLADRLRLRLLITAPHALTRRVLRLTAADGHLEVHPDLPTALHVA
ncbi:STAS domain-containing protein [Streptomyces sp. NPDC087300]|uniref:STAS domain-containing protein n=1 Tax=Streptomyces sp. NPDC087300 TaxID=3365780 RepID=UPI00382FAA0B